MLFRYNARRRNKWSGNDTFYDAWLLRNGYRRKEFNVALFKKRYPDVNLDDDITETEYEEPQEYVTEQSTIGSIPTEQNTAQENSTTQTQENSTTQTQDNSRTQEAVTIPETEEDTKPIVIEDEERFMPTVSIDKEETIYVSD